MLLLLHRWQRIPRLGRCLQFNTDVRGTTWLVTNASKADECTSYKSCLKKVQDVPRKYVTSYVCVKWESRKHFLRVSKRDKMACAIKSENCNCVNVTLTYCEDRQSSISALTRLTTTETTTDFISPNNMQRRTVQCRSHSATPVSYRHTRPGT